MTVPSCRIDRTRRALAVAGLAALPARIAQSQTLAAPNVVVISPRLVTSGQPGAAALSQLGAQGFRAVVYLAPPTVSDAVREEPAILAAQGIDYVNIPIPFGDPTEAHFAAFAQTMARLGDTRTLVHCQVNMRASTLVFLERVIVRGELPDTAFEAVAKVWSPSGPWRRLIVTLLKRHGIGFEPY
jgi:protein tyrosine phosphatase (PTP) superfamily phosphohydrolase (DUF442 family)